MATTYLKPGERINTSDGWKEGLNEAVVTAERPKRKYMTLEDPYINSDPETIDLSDFLDNNQLTINRNLLKQNRKQNRKDQGGISFGGNWLNPLAKGINSISPLFTQMNETGNSTSLGIRDAASSAMINSGQPALMAAGTIAKVVDAIGDATDLHLDDVDKDAAKRAGVSGGQLFLNNAMQAIPGLGTAVAALSPNKTNEVKQLDQFGENMLAGYSGVANDLNAAKQLSKKRMLFGSSDSNNFIKKADKEVDVMNKLGKTNTLRKQSDYSRDLAQQNLNRYAGTNYQMNAVGKHGMKIMSRQELQAILATKKFQKGGVIGTDTNLLPEGALHARLHHLDEVNPDLEDVTKKGIPVLDSNGEQVAEIEKEELILRLELTKKIEELMKDSSDEAMIEAGKLLVNEIIENTQDNTGQLTEEVQNGN